MKLLRIATTGALAIAFATGCGDSTDPQDDVTLADLVGTWNATGITYTNNATGQTINAFLFGARLQITVAANGTYTGSVTEPGGTPEAITGTVSVQGSNITITDDAAPGDAAVGTFTLSGNTLTITAQDEFDFGAGEVSATLVLVMER
jgi:hypothetical protein